MSTDTFDTRATLEQLFRDRIVIIDGAMGTAIQGFGLKEADYRGERYADHPKELFGCNDLLVHTRPDVIQSIHKAYLEAGADIIETNTFNGTSISMAEYGMQDEVYGINKAAAELAKAAATEVMAADPSRPRFVAGALGPTSTSASLSPDVSNPAYRAYGFDAIAEAYYGQVVGLMDGGVDILMPETTFDTLNLKAALFAIERYFRETGTRVPVIASVTITDRSGRTLSGQTVEAFWTAISHAGLTAVSMNCALGAEEMRPFLEALSSVAPIPVCCYPNAGLPNEMGEYDETPDSMAAHLVQFADEGLLNAVGGCCGTRPEHIAAIAKAMVGRAPRQVPEIRPVPTWSGLEPYSIYEGSTFTMVGERTNVAGSRKFRDLIRAGDFETAVGVARKQVEGGANVLDVNMDEGLLDSAEVMATFLNQLAAEPDVARVPIMVDSSRFEVVEAGLKCVQGKCIVNSLSLKEGEAAFLAQADRARRYGASVIVMAFDEEGQATDVERRVAICGRAYDLLTQQVGFAPHDIIFDPNILAIGTGMEEHDDYGVTFIEAIPRIKQRCPGALISGGVSNLSFSFRGMNHIREAIHAVFLYHAIAAGMDMGIVNAGQLSVYDEIPKDLLELTEDLVLNRRPDATERLITWGENNRGKQSKAVQTAAWRSEPLEERIKHALLKGNADYIDADMAEALEDPRYGQPLDIIEGPLMAGMSVVGDLFGAGKMFLPQVVKSARVMKKAVAHLEPYMEREDGETSAGRILMATVKGDVHDIGKNIVGVVLRCNGFEVIDLGVMVPAETILDAAVEHRVAAIGLSGLITPSLDEMVHVAREMERRGMKTPLLIGGATTSKKHTAVKIAPAYSNATLHVLDASRAVTAVGSMLSPNEREAAEARNREEQAVIRERYEARRAQAPLLPVSGARAKGTGLDFSAYEPPTPGFFGVREVEVDIETVIPFIDWGPFFSTWELRASWKTQMEDPEVGPRYRELWDDAHEMLNELVANRSLTLRGVYGFVPAAADGDDIALFGDTANAGVETERFHMLRQQQQRKGKTTPFASLADFVAPADEEGKPRDAVGIFAVTAGIGAETLVERHRADHDDYKAIMTQALADRLAEAFTEWLHQRMRAEWGFADAADTDLDALLKARYRGIRPAFGYPACPDHTEKKALFELLGAENVGIELTSSYAMTPAASVSGVVFSHPDARYFGVGLIGRDQVDDYARRKGWTRPEAERWLGPNLGYDVD